MRYGFFDDVNREYVITQPDTPLPWMNYIGCENYFGLISNTAGGYSFYKDARLRRISRYRYNNTPSIPEVVISTSVITMQVRKGRSADLIGRQHGCRLGIPSMSMNAGMARVIR